MSVLNLKKMRKVIIMYISAFYEKGIMFLISFLLARVYGADIFGSYSYYMAIGGIIFVLFDLGGDFYLSKLLVQDKENYSKTISSVCIVKFINFILVYVVSILYEIIVGNFDVLLNLVLIAFFMDSLNSICKSISYVSSEYIKESIINICEKTLLILGIVILVLFKYSIEFIFIIMIMTKLVSFIIRIIKIKNYETKIHIIFEGVSIKKIGINSFIYIIHALLVTIFFQVDILMVKYILGTEAVGFYNAAVKLVLGVMVFPDVLFKFFYPKISKYAKTDKDKLNFTFNKFLLIEILVSIPIFLVMFIFNNEIIHVIYGEKYIQSANVLGTLCFMIIFRFTMYPFTAVLTAGEKQVLKTVTSATCTLVNVVINLVLIPRMGIEGAAIATVITEFILLVMYYMFSRKIIKNIDKRNKLILLLYAVIVLITIIFKI